MSQTTTIPASEIVRVVPGVISAGGTAQSLTGLALSSSVRTPIGQVLSFPNATAVGAYYGLASNEYAAANIYFTSFINADTRPAAMLFAQVPQASVAGYLRGGQISGLTLTQLQAITSGTLTIVVDGVSHVSSTINLASATSFSNAATIIGTAYTQATVTYDAIAGAFVFTSTTTGAASSVAFPTTGALATALLLTQATGAVTSAGSVAPTPAAAMVGITAVTTNWGGFTTLFDPDGGSGNTLKLAYAAWTNGQNDQYFYAGWDTDITSTQSGSATSSFGYLVSKTDDYNGTIPIYSNAALAGVTGYYAFGSAVLALSWAASLNFGETNGRFTLAFRSQTGLIPDVTNGTVAPNLIANGYNFYGIYATAAQNFNFFYPGSLSGPFDWADSYVNQIWLNGELQLALMELLTQVGNIPYTAYGYALIRDALQDPVNAALNFGAIRAGVPLSTLQAAEVNALAGNAVDQIITAQGYFISVQAASAQVRGARGSPPCTLFYADGQSVQSINLSSLEVA